MVLEANLFKITYFELKLIGSVENKYAAWEQIIHWRFHQKPKGCILSGRVSEYDIEFWWIWSTDIIISLIMSEMSRNRGQNLMRVYLLPWATKLVDADFQSLPLSGNSHWQCVCSWSILDIFLFSSLKYSTDNSHELNSLNYLPVFDSKGGLT